MKLLDRIALTLLIIAGLHLVLTHLFQIDLVSQWITPIHPYAEDIFYMIIGISTLWCFKYYNYTPRGGSRLRGR